ncbi:hypothetical protein ACOMHN_052289 [Nucella lapillus]
MVTNLKLFSLLCLLQPGVGPEPSDPTQAGADPTDGLTAPMDHNMTPIPPVNGDGRPSPYHPHPYTTPHHFLPGGGRAEGGGGGGGSSGEGSGGCPTPSAGVNGHYHNLQGSSYGFPNMSYEVGLMQQQQQQQQQQQHLQLQHMQQQQQQQSTAAVLNGSGTSSVGHSPQPPWSTGYHHGPQPGGPSPPMVPAMHLPHRPPTTTATHNTHPQAALEFDWAGQQYFQGSGIPHPQPSVTNGGTPPLHSSPHPYHQYHHHHYNHYPYRLPHPPEGMYDFSSPHSLQSLVGDNAPPGENGGSPPEGGGFVGGGGVVGGGSGTKQLRPPFEWMKPANLQPAPVLSEWSRNLDWILWGFGFALECFYLDSKLHRYPAGSLSVVMESALDTVDFLAVKIGIVLGFETSPRILSVSLTSRQFGQCGYGIWIGYCKTRTKDKYRVVYSDHQRLELEKEFHYSRYITIRRKVEISQELSLSERQVKIWFQNRRAKERKEEKKKSAAMRMAAAGVGGNNNSNNFPPKQEPPDDSPPFGGNPLDQCGFPNP